MFSYRFKRVFTPTKRKNRTDVRQRRHARRQRRRYQKWHDRKEAEE